MPKWTRSQQEIPSGDQSLMPQTGDPEFTRKFEAYLATIPEPTFEQRYLDQCQRWAQEAGSSLWVNAPRSVGIGSGPAGSITYAVADRKATAFVTPNEGWLPFRDFAELFGENPFILDDKERAPLVALAWVCGQERWLVKPNGDRWETGGAQRMVFNSRGVTCVGLDFDENDTTLGGIVAALEKHGLEGFVHSTFSSTAEKPRHRCIVPLTEPYHVMHDDRDARREFKARYHGLARMLGAGTADHACSDPLRLFRLPSHKPDGHYEWAYVEGAPLNLRSVTPDYGGGRIKARAFREDGDERPRASLRHIEQALSFVPACVEYPTWRDVIWAVHSAVSGTTDETSGRKCVEAWSKTCPSKFDQRAFDELWASADADGGVSIRSLWHSARAYGFDDMAEAINELPNWKELV